MGRAGCLAARGGRPLRQVSALDSTRAEPQALDGTVARVVYRDPGSAYTVLRLKVDGAPVLQAAVGRAPELDEGATVHLEGHWVEHPTHGRQFQFERVQVKAPVTSEGIERRLRRYPGIGPTTAARVVQHFGADALRVLDEDPARLLEVPGLGERSLERIVAYHQAHQGPLARIEARLLELGLTPHLAEAIHHRYGDDALDVLAREPYRLARDVRGVGFLTADKIARAHGVGLDSPERVEAGLLYALERAEGEGHCALPVPDLVRDSARLLQVPPEDTLRGLERLCEAAHLVVADDVAPEPLVYRHPMWVVEDQIAQILADLAGTPVTPWAVEALPGHLGPGQAQAVRAVAAHRVVLLTGGPGTGKSTVVHTVIELARRNDCEVLLCAPTGRAAKRLEQATGHEARTVHRLLEIQPEDGGFVHGRDDPLPPGLVVVDEASMLDVWLARALLAALDDGHRLLLVGDADQLPSVGPGNVLRDVLEAAAAAPEVMPVVRLHQVFRQAEGSSIVANAHRILAGERPHPDAPGGEGEFFVVRPRDVEHAQALVLRTVTERIPRVFGLDPRTEVQVLTPMHRGAVGTEALNRLLQAHLTGTGTGLTAPGGGRTFHVGDRVMHTRNDYERGVFNGDVGVVARVDPERRELVVDMDGSRVRYEHGDLSALQLAYAVSIHKSQGSEFPAVVVVLMPDHHVMLRRNLLYTAVTRARRLCVLVADPRAIDRALRRADAARRHTGLAARLRRRLGGGPHWHPDPA